MTEPSPTVDLTVTPVPVALSDGALVRRFRQGERTAAELLFRRYADRLRSMANSCCANGYAHRFDGDDIVQSVFRVFFEGVRRDRYDAGENQEVWSLLRVLAINKVREKIKHHRMSKRDVSRTSSAEADSPGATDDGEVALLRLILDEQLVALSPARRQIVLLRLEGYEVREIAMRTAQPLRTVERVLQNFRATLNS